MFFVCFFFRLYKKKSVPIFAFKREGDSMVIRQAFTNMDSAVYYSDL